MKYLLIFSILFCTVGYSQQAIDINVQDEINFVPGAAINLDANYITYLFPTDTIGDIDYWYANRATDSLAIPSPYSPEYNTAIHPYVMDMHEFGKGNWLGYRYIMTFTPLNQIGPNYIENPCIVASNDLVTWVKPAQITNPIVGNPPHGYNADPFLYFENDSMYLGYRTMTTVDTIAYVAVRASKDGINWTPQQLLLMDHMYDFTHFAAPTMFKDGLLYYMYFTDAVEPDGYGRFMHRYRSDNIRGPWIPSDTLIFNTTNTKLGELPLFYPTSYWYVWHGEVRKIGSKYLLGAFVRSGNSDYAGMYFAESSDGINFNFAKYPITSLMYYQNTRVTFCDWFYKFTFLPYHTDNGLGMNIIYSGVPKYFEDYPSYLGLSKINTVKNIVIGAIGNVVSANYLTSVDSACALQGDYILGDKFNRTVNPGVGTSTSGHEYTIENTNSWRVDNGLVRVTTANAPYCRFFWDLEEDSTETSYWVYNTSQKGFLHLRYRNADTTILYNPFNNTLRIRRGTDTDIKRAYNRTMKSSALVVADSVLVTIKIMGPTVIIYNDDCEALRYTFVVGDFADQAQMNRMIGATKSGFEIRNVDWRLFYLKVKHLRKQ